ncbi:unnamed protein product [Caenorhabditis angaria]|uniref:Phosphotyrosine protein phosphatase I domain-containing protein n=1 Tax=Caenorhabditis angaria TaxID=860376 RepID=A0A9P1IQH0_9PELO|nr:unnamed protein product [Caenorhabditis angaria]
MSSEKKSALFVCLGNICRSPIAEAVFIDCLEKRGKRDEWIVDSSAVIGYHTGKGPDHRAMETLKKFGISTYQHKARVTSTGDFKTFDYIFGMDDDNISDLQEIQRLAGNESKAKLGLLGEFDPQGEREVPDPYYNSGSAIMSATSYVMYLVLRRDLGWPMGAVCTQAAHAASAAIWLFRNDPNTEKYTSELDSMHKVTLGCDSEEEIKKIAEKLESKKIDHKVWIEDGMPVCIALKPYPKDEVKNACASHRLLGAMVARSTPDRKTNHSETENLLKFMITTLTTIMASVYMLSVGSIGLLGNFISMGIIFKKSNVA